MTSAPFFIVATMASLFISGPFVGTQAKVAVCGLLPRAEVRKLVGATEAFDRVEPSEQPTKTGSSCRYFDLLVMVYEGNLDGVRKNAKNFEALSGVGQEAYIYQDQSGAVELFARVGARELVVSRKAEAGSTAGDTRSGVIALAKALAAKLQ